MMKKDELYDELREILKKNRDAKKGFAKAAENAESTTLRNYFREKSSKRGNFNEKLTQAISSVYTDFDVDGTFSGTVHRVWMDIKALFSADDDEAMLEESIRGDEAAIEEYNDVLDEAELPIVLRDLLLQQRADIQSDVNKNRSLENMQ